ncbi:hypothetical protein [Rubritalea sp.]|uniref:hypothetical protein n=1 Tax=Rubritalea sp. TaxID=2109375 RepID=UPI003EF6B0FA
MELESFLSRVAKRLNLNTTIKASIYGALAFALVGILLALVYVLRGYAVPWYVFAISITVAFLTSIILTARSWHDKRKAADFADRHFNLKNGIITSLHLAEQEDNQLNPLQQQWTAQQVSTCNASTIPLTYSKKLAVCAFLLTTVTASMALIPTSSHIIEQQIETAETKQRTQHAIDELKKVVEEMEKDLSEEEAKEIDMDAIKQKVDSLEATGDRKEAVRQFARLEQKAREMSKSLEQKRDQETLKKAIEQLKKSPSREAKEIAKKLEDKDFKEAAKQLKALQPKKTNPKESKEKQLAEARKQIEKLRSVSKQLASASKSSQQGNGGSGSAGAAGLAADMEALDQEVKSLENALNQAELEFQRNPNLDLQKLNQKLPNCENGLNQVANKWMKMQAKLSAKKRLDGL